jgi:hypothetical protein
VAIRGGDRTILGVFGRKESSTGDLAVRFGFVTGSDIRVTEKIRKWNREPEVLNLDGSSIS